MTVLTKITRLLFGGLLVGCLAIMGCGGGESKPANMPTLYPITLKFTQEGQPCAGALVILIPQDTNKWTTGGITDAAGGTVLKTHGKYLGVPAGKFKITVSKQETDADGTAYNLINPDYGDISKTTLNLEVVAGKNQFEPFDIGKVVRLQIVNTATY